MRLSSVRRIATEITFGLQALHQRGMLHRDIKPANILLDADGVALLGDFGWVTDEIFLGYAKAGGYLDHLAYEAWTQGSASIKADVWALGMTLYRLLHGKNWYSRQGTPRFDIPKGGFFNSLEWLPHISVKWRRVLRLMLIDDPSARYANCEQMLAAFAALPIDPDWECFVSDDLISWSLRQKMRIHKVEWIRHSERKHEWRAWTEPVAKGRQKAMGGSGGLIGRAECVKQLKAYFAKC
jgi:serine/threonine-protein kinase